VCIDELRDSFAEPAWLGKQALEFGTVLREVVDPEGRIRLGRGPNVLEELAGGFGVAGQSESYSSVIGAPRERFWEERFRRALEGYEARIQRLYLRGGASGEGDSDAFELALTLVSVERVDTVAEVEGEMVAGPPKEMGAGIEVAPRGPATGLELDDDQVPRAVAEPRTRTSLANEAKRCELVTRCGRDLLSVGSFAHVAAA
jgi:hypothetical protein